MTSVKVRSGEPIEKALRALKKKVDKEGILKTIKRKRYALKPSDSAREKSKNALKYKQKKFR